LAGEEEQSTPKKVGKWESVFRESSEGKDVYLREGEKMFFVLFHKIFTMMGIKDPMRAEVAVGDLFGVVLSSLEVSVILSFSLLSFALIYLFPSCFLPF